MAADPAVALTAAARWFERVDPGANRRIKGLRLVTAYALAAMLGAMPDIARGLPSGATLSALAGGLALWASVSEGRGTRAASTRDLLLLSGTGVAGALSFIGLAPLLRTAAPVGPELILASGAFAVGALRRFGLTGAGIGSQIFIGQLLAYGAGLGVAGLQTVIIAGLLAAVAAIVPRLLSGAAERPPPEPPPIPRATALLMGTQAGAAAIAIVALNAAIGLSESGWAITACTYVVASSTAGTIDRVRRRILGTLIGVPLGLAFLPLAADLPIVVWCAAAVAMVIYAMALPDRYDVACGAYAFTLIVTLALTGEHSIGVLVARAWETLLGGAIGLAVCALVILVDRAVQRS